MNQFPLAENFQFPISKKSQKWAWKFEPISSVEIVTLINFQCGKIDFNQVPVSKKGLNMFKVRLSFLISNILFKIVVNDVLNNPSMMVVTSLKSPEPCNKEIIEYDLEENI